MAQKEKIKKKVSQSDDAIKQRFNRMGVPTWAFWNNFYFMKNPNQLTVVYMIFRGIPLLLVVWFASSNDLYMPFIMDALKPFDEQSTMKVLFLKRLLFYTPVLVASLAYGLFILLIPGDKRRRNRKKLRRFQFDCFVFTAPLVMGILCLARLTGKTLYTNYFICTFLSSKFVAIVFNLFTKKIVGYQFLFEVVGTFPVILFYNRNESLQWAAILYAFSFFFEDWCASASSLAKLTSTFTPIRKVWILIVERIRAIGLFIITFFVLPLLAFVFQIYLSSSEVFIGVCVVQFFINLYGIHQLRVTDATEEPKVSLNEKKNQ